MTPVLPAYDTIALDLTMTRALLTSANADRDELARKLQALETAIDGAEVTALTPPTTLLISAKHWRAIVDARGERV